MGRKVFIITVASLLGLLVMAQIRSFSVLNSYLARDSQSNVFHEIKILKEQNADLRREVDDLEENLEQLSDQNLALDAIEEEIEEYMKLSGAYGVFGAGVQITIDYEITTTWIVDLVNEFFASGAEAVSVNGIRIVNYSAGFDTLPQGQILLNGSILSPPYTFSIIGDSSTILSILELPGGIFDRLEARFSDVRIETVPKEIIQMD